eukprot:c18829_g1_i2.p1 GENE.c18829_g1_i2~~c18829_g1_i2.p1  ORF type:complete len:104 (+),score=16.07 c18829_g1_i2:202-513(+)
MKEQKYWMLVGLIIPNSGTDVEYCLLNTFEHISKKCITDNILFFVITDADDDLDEISLKNRLEESELLKFYHFFIQIGSSNTGASEKLRRIFQNYHNFVHIFS